MKRESISIGKDVIGVGVGALILGSDNKFLLSKRGVDAKNEVGLWELPGGEVEFGEELRNAIKREVAEELDIQIQPKRIINVFDHIIPEEQQHWVTVTFLCKLSSGKPLIKEIGKSEELRWVSTEEALKLPLSAATRSDIEKFSVRSLL